MRRVQDKFSKKARAWKLNLLTCWHSSPYNWFMNLHCPLSLMLLLNLPTKSHFEETVLFDFVHANEA